MNNVIVFWHGTSGICLTRLMQFPDATAYKRQAVRDERGVWTGPRGKLVLVHVN